LPTTHTLINMKLSILPLLLVGTAATTRNLKKNKSQVRRPNAPGPDPDAPPGPDPDAPPGFGVDTDVQPLPPAFTRDALATVLIAQFCASSRLVVKDPRNHPPPEDNPHKRSLRYHDFLFGLPSSSDLQMDFAIGCPSAVDTVQQLPDSAAFLFTEYQALVTAFCTPFCAAPPSDNNDLEENSDTGNTDVPPSDIPAVDGNAESEP
jgi:hypothetical protein